MNILNMMLMRLTRPEELATSCPHGGPQVGRELLGVLVLQDELRDRPLPQRPSRPHRPHASLLFHQLAIHQRHQFPLHGSAEGARTQSRHTFQKQNVGENYWYY